MKILFAADGSKFTKKALAFLVAHDEFMAEGSEASWALTGTACSGVRSWAALRSASWQARRFLSCWRNRGG